MRDGCSWTASNAPVPSEVDTCIGVVNIGAATLKLALFEVSSDGLRQRWRQTHERPATGDGTGWLRERLAEFDPVPAAIGHRIVHGGASLTVPQVITAAVEASLEATIPLAPLHNPPALEAARAARALWPDVPSVAVFDTAYHAGRPRVAMQYALPRDLVEAHAIYRYGFHGLAHESLLEALAEFRHAAPADTTAVSLQLGAGCSACAIQHGRSLETSMGYTPLEGLVMGTRSGSVDPAIPLRLMRAGHGADEIESLLTQRSGLLALAGTADMRTLCADAARGDLRAEAALELFAYRVVLTVGAYFTILNGEGALVFGGGIGGNAPAVRARICESLTAWGIRLDPEKNARNVPGRISAEGTRDVYVCRTDEERIIARQVLACLARAP